MKTIKTILEDLCDDVAEDIILGNMQKQIHVDQALSEIEELIDSAKPGYLPVSNIHTVNLNSSYNDGIDEFDSKLKELLGDK